MPIVFSMLQLYKRPRKNRTLGLTYEIVYIPPHILEKMTSK